MAPPQTLGLLVRSLDSTEIPRERCVIESVLVFMCVCVFESLRAHTGKNIQASAGTEKLNQFRKHALTTCANKGVKVALLNFRQVVAYSEIKTTK